MEMPGVSRGTRKQEMPFARREGSLVANRVYMSATSPLEMKPLVPLMITLSPSTTYVVRIAAESEPAFGSVRVKDIAPP